MTDGTGHNTAYLFHVASAAPVISDTIGVKTLLDCSCFHEESSHIQKGRCALPWCGYICLI